MDFSTYWVPNKAPAKWYALLKLSITESSLWLLCNLFVLYRMNCYSFSMKINLFHMLLTLEKKKEKAFTLGDILQNLLW